MIINKQMKVIVYLMSAAAASGVVFLKALACIQCIIERPYNMHITPI